MSLTIPACYYSLRLPLKVCRTVWQLLFECDQLA
jgi:hypothetical protein